MKTCGLLPAVSFVAAVALSEASGPEPKRAEPGIDLAQVPTWSDADLEFFLHGSMSTEVVPERVLQAFLATYPNLFPKKDLSNFGLIPDEKAGLPIGVSRRDVPHLGGLSSIGVNCASCHVGQIDFGAGKRPIKPLRVLGMTGQFDAEAFLGSVVVATFRTADPANMKRYLANYAAASEPKGGANTEEFKRQDEKIAAAVEADPFGSKDVAPGALHKIGKLDVEPGTDLAVLARGQLKLFHNMRAALHVPDQPPQPSPPNGPGRNDPWRILSYSLLGVVTKPAPIKFGIVWNADQRSWVHVDANTRSPIIRNLAASLGLGAPLLGRTGVLDFAAIERHTALTEVIRPPRYPLTIDRAAAERGSKLYQANCASCHDGPADDRRLHSIAEIKTDPNRAEIFTPEIAEQFNRFFAELQIPGYQPPEKPLRGTQKYWSPDLAGVWARSPYLHNGSVRTMRELLTRPGERAKSFHRGARAYDASQMGYADEGAYILDTTTPGNSNAGHDYGTGLSDAEKRELIEYLKTL